MAEQADRGAERKRSKRGGFWATWRERLSFAATLITVSAVAIFLGWLMGQYAIQAVTGPAPSTTMLERSPTPSPAESFSPAPSSITSTGSTTSRSTTAASTSSAPTASGTSQASTTPSATTPTATTSSTTTSSATAPSGLWRVQVGAFNDRNRADALAAELRARGFDVFVSGQPPHRVQVGAFSQESRARATAEDLRALGYEAIVIPPG